MLAYVLRFRPGKITSFFSLNSNSISNAGASALLATIEKCTIVNLEYATLPGGDPR